jgi:hypothetical protein
VAAHHAFEINPPRSSFDGGNVGAGRLKQLGVDLDVLAVVVDVYAVL